MRKVFKALILLMMGLASLKVSLIIKIMLSVCLKEKEMKSIKLEVSDIRVKLSIL